MDPTRGGLVCRACGGASGVLGPEVRAVARALVRGESKNITESHAEAVLGLVDRAMAAHAGFER